MYDIKFTDGTGNFTYTTYNAGSREKAEILWQDYVRKHFVNKCRIIDIRNVLNDIR